MPIKPLATLLKVLLRQGYDLEATLAAIGLDFDPLEATRQTRVSTESYSKLYALLMESEQDEAFGLGEHYRSPPGSFRMMCLQVIHTRTLEQALRRAAAFFDYCDQYRTPLPPPSPPPLLALQGGRRTLCIFQRGQTQQPTVVQANVLYMMYRFYSWLVGKPLPLLGVYLQGDIGAPGGPIEALFDCGIHYQKSHAGLLLQTPALQLPVVQTEESLKLFLRQAPHQLVRRDAPGADKPLTDKVQQLLASHDQSALPGASEVAMTLNMSARTLHRRLSQEDTSFQQLKDAFRSTLARHYLGRDDLSIDAISALMGFQDNSAFYRSFRKWTGEAPGAYRRTLASSNRSADAQDAQ